MPYHRRKLADARSGSFPKDGMAFAPYSSLAKNLSAIKMWVRPGDIIIFDEFHSARAVGKSGSAAGNAAG